MKKSDFLESIANSVNSKAKGIQTSIYDYLKKEGEASVKLDYVYFGGKEYENRVQVILLKNSNLRNQVRDLLLLDGWDLIKKDFNEDHRSWSRLTVK